MKNVFNPLKVLPLTLIALISVSAALLVEDNVKLPIIEKFEKWNADHPEERVYLQFDKTLYQPGETVWFAGYVRHANDLTPDSVSDILHVEILNPRGAVQQHLKYVLKNGVANGNFTFSDEMAGGVYKFRAYTLYSLNDSTIKLFQKEVTLQKSVLSNLLMKLDFKEKGYNPGQTAEAKLEIKTPNGQPLALQQFTYEILTAGVKTDTANGTTDVMGNAVIRYNIPAGLQSADLLLNVHLTYNHNTESVSRSVPVNLKSVQIEFYPEGGDMVYGLSNRVAFSAVDDFGKPVNVEGAVYNDANQPVAIIKSIHHGMGSFELTPEKGRTYYALLNNYGNRHFSFKEIKTEGIVLEVNKVNKDELAVKVTGTGNKPVTVVTQMRGKVYDYQNLDGITANTATIPLKQLPCGVAQITVFDHSNRPLAERMVFVNKEQQLQLQITTNKEKYQPGDKVRMSVKARDLNNKPASADVCVSVVDDKVLTLANDKSGTILSRMLLEADITGDVEEPDYYFDPSEPKADEALDLLMMTRGWRRFVWNKVLSNDSAAYAQKAERKVIAGDVMNFKDGKPTRYSTVYVMGTDLQATTDKNGHFELYGADLSEVQVLAVKKLSKELYYNVNDYGPDHKLDFNAGRTFYGRSYNYSEGTSNSGSRNSYNNSPSVGRGNYRATHKATKPIQISYTSPGKGEFTGTIVDENNEGMFGATLAETSNGALTGTGAVTDFDGNFKITGLSPGNHSFNISYIGYERQTLTVNIHSNENTKANIYMDPLAIELNEVVVATSAYKAAIQYETVSMEVVNSRSVGIENAISRVPGVEVDVASNIPQATGSSINRGNGVEKDNNSNLTAKNGVEISYYKVPYFDPNAVGNNVVTAEEIAAMTTRNVTDIAAITSGVFQKDEGGGMRVLGDRNDGTVYYIDGVRVTGKPDVQADNIQNVTIITGGWPARYNNASGVVQIETKKAEPVTYYTYPGTRVSVLNEGIMAKYSASREFPKIIHKEANTKHSAFDNRTTIYWSGIVHTDDFGRADIEFYCNDEISNFRATAEGISDEGMVGHAEKTFHTEDAIGITAKFPTEAVNGDVLDIPVVLTNGTSTTLSTQLKFTIPNGWWPLQELPAAVELSPNGTATVELKLKAGAGQGEAAFLINATSGKYEQRVYKNVLLKQAGYPEYFSKSGSLSNQTFQVQLPDYVDSSFRAQLTMYPTGPGNLIDAVKGMIQEPHGCFEQVSSSTYPNIMALQMLQQMNSADEKTRTWATQCIGEGYAALSHYEVAGGGFDLYGQAPANIPMTAYGLMEFTEMKKVYPQVSSDLIARTKAFLLAQKNSDGFNLGSKDSYYSGVHRKQTANAYICWALSEAGVTEVSGIADKLTQTAGGKDPYVLALLANTGFNLGRKDLGAGLNRKLIALQQPNGSFTGTEGTIVGSGSAYADIEASALAVLALSHEYSTYENEIKNAVSYLLSNRSYGGRFGNTQCTILALKAIMVAHLNNNELLNSAPPAFSVNGTTFNLDSLNLQSGYASVINGFQTLLKAGVNEVQLTTPVTSNQASFNFACKWQSYLPVSNPACAVDMHTSFNKTEVPLGETVRMNIELTNKVNSAAPTPMVIINIPGGLSLQNWQLKELMDKKAFDYYETDGNQLRLYFYGFTANEHRNIALDLKTEVKGEYSAPASCAYSYYSDFAKQWVPGMKIAIR